MTIEFRDIKSALRALADKIEAHTSTPQELRADVIEILHGVEDLEVSIPDKSSEEEELPQVAPAARYL